MPAPSDYDPVEVTPLHPDEVARMRAEGLAAIAGATDLDGLKEVRLAHTGDRSPLALANREIGALPPQARKEAGQRVGAARSDLINAIAHRQAVLEAERDERVRLRPKSTRNDQVSESTRVRARFPVRRRCIM